MELADDVSELQYRQWLIEQILMVETVHMDMKRVVFLVFRKSILFPNQKSKMERGI